jgi:hypothetical protein
MTAAIVALHLGALHPFEKGLTLLLAFGPFVVLGIVIALRHRQDVAEERAEQRVGGAAGAGAGDAGTGDAGAGDEGVSGRATPGRPGSRS